MRLSTLFGAAFCLAAGFFTNQKWWLAGALVFAVAGIAWERWDTVRKRRIRQEEIRQKYEVPRPTGGDRDEH